MVRPKLADTLKAKFLRAGWAYRSVLSGANPVIGSSTHEYKKLKAFIIYCGGFAPLLFKNEVFRYAIHLTKSSKKWVVLPVIFN